MGLSMIAFQTLIEDCTTLVDTPQLYGIECHLIMATLSTTMLNDHLTFAPPLQHLTISIILMQPLLILANDHLRGHHLSCMSVGIPANSRNDLSQPQT